jgi:hypothetical protein
MIKIVLLNIIKFIWDIIFIVSLCNIIVYNLLWEYGYFDLVMGYSFLSSQIMVVFLIAFAFYRNFVRSLRNGPKEVWFKGNGVVTLISSVIHVGLVISIIIASDKYLLGMAESTFYFLTPLYYLINNLASELKNIWPHMTPHLVIEIVPVIIAYMLYYAARCKLGEYYWSQKKFTQAMKEANFGNKLASSMEGIGRDVKQETDNLFYGRSKRR